VEFRNLEELKQTFITGKFMFPNDIYVSGVKYTSNASSSYDIKDLLRKNYKMIWTYSTSNKEGAREQELDAVIAFLWGFTPNKTVMVPYDVRLTTKARANAPITETSPDGEQVSIAKEKIVGDVVDVIITNLPGTKPMRGKIDTGADVSSLHIESFEIKNNQVSFHTPELSDNKITTPVIEKQAVRLSNGEVEYRPVIELNIKINNVYLTNCMFNLNDRGAMKYPMLIGQNVLEAGGFMVDPSINDPTLPETFDFSDLQEEYKDDVVVDHGQNTIQEIIKLVNT